MNSFNQFFNLDFWQKIFELNESPWRLVMSILDIAIVSYFLYRVIGFIQGTKLMTLVRGVIVFIAIKVVAGLAGLTTVEWLLNQVITYGAIAIVIIFQPEIRRALESLGRTSTFLIPSRSARTSDHVAAYEKSFAYMSERRIGALIAIEQAQSLEEFASTGIRLDADVSSELIINIFIPNTPLHDGAVIVQGDKIAVTSAYLPLTEKSGISKEFGTRHRAAIGLSEVSDALVLVVSEETGGISVAHNGQFMADISKEKFHELLTATLSAPTASAESKKGGKKK
ncbi:diadenylate cyclase CdaA [Lactococcus termiticola]|uniref:Diadenylate cyclase n=1 Tax=Lactococcus termiticola TaxID=2169526 RepID=A0A2R5HD79_9LACT|nr:diadenylate cyclase CdaA [Lactococcus termiticola]GBG96029.1 membrane protein [Lactococcus termiticola]